MIRLAGSRSSHLPAITPKRTLHAAGSVLTSPSGSQVRDFAQLLPHILRIMFYISGILYDVERFETHKKIFDVIKLTPFYTYIALTRNAIFGGGYATSSTWIVAAAWSFVLLPLGLIYFWRAEEKYGRD